MANPKQRCPNCHALAFKSTKTSATELGDHELENARVSYWKCAVCGCYAQLIIPKSRLTVIKKGDVTEDMIRRVLTKLGLTSEIPGNSGKFREIPGNSGKTEHQSPEKF